MAATTTEVNAYLVDAKAVAQDMIDALGFNADKRWVRTDLELISETASQTKLNDLAAVANNTGTRTSGASAAVTANVNSYIVLLKLVEPLYMAQVEALNNKDWSEVQRLRALTASYRAAVDSADTAVGNIGGVATEDGADQTEVRSAFDSLGAAFVALDNALGYRLEKNWEKVDVELASAISELAQVPNTVTDRT